MAIVVFLRGDDRGSRGRGIPGVLGEDDKASRVFPPPLDEDDGGVRARKSVTPQKCNRGARGGNLAVP